jgi:hypothetical protein
MDFSKAQTDFSRPTKRGITMKGKITMSLSGSSGNNLLSELI